MFALKKVLFRRWFTPAEIVVIVNDMEAYGLPMHTLNRVAMHGHRAVYDAMMGFAWDQASCMADTCPDHVSEAFR